MEWKIASKRDLQRINFSNGKLYLLFFFLQVFTRKKSFLQSIENQSTKWFIEKNCNVIKCWSMKRNFQCSSPLLLSSLHHLQVFPFPSKTKNFTMKTAKISFWKEKRKRTNKLYWIQLEIFLKYDMMWKQLMLEATSSSSLTPSLLFNCSVFIKR